MTAFETDIEFGDDPEPRKFSLRGRQPEWLETIDTDLPLHRKVLVVAPGGIGKSSIMGQLALRYHHRGLKTLVLANRDKLAHQTAGRISAETGIEVGIEMGEYHASPFDPIVVASVQTLGRMNRLTGFSPDNFGLLLCDECHFSMAAQYQRIMSYFHYGAESLDELWEPPVEYKPKALIAGFTATPYIGERRTLGDFYNHISVNYSYLEAVQEGWLVGPRQISIPIKVDLRKYKAKNTPTGMDFSSADLSEALEPIIEELADQCVSIGHDRKAMHFLPSVQCARMMSEALNRRGLESVYVSGECVDGDEKTDWFQAAGPGTSLCNAQIYGFGIDFPDVDCIGWFRATLSRAFYIQGIYRASRVLKGVVDGLDTAEERVAAIAASTKKDYLVIDPLFVHDRIDLLDAYDLYTDKPEVKEKMKAVGDLSPEAAEKAERDFLKSLAKEAKKHAKKKARIIDPLAWAISVGDETLVDWVPVTSWDSGSPTKGQLDFLARQGIDVSKITYKGMAQKIIGRVLNRMKLGLASAHQLSFLKQLGIADPDAPSMTAAEASAVIDKVLAEKRTRHE